MSGAPGNVSDVKVGDSNWFQLAVHMDILRRGTGAQYAASGGPYEGCRSLKRQ